MNTVLEILKSLPLENIKDAKQVSHIPKVCQQAICGTMQDGNIYAAFVAPNSKMRFVWISNRGCFKINKLMEENHR